MSAPGNPGPVISPVEFARNRANLAGTLQVAAMSRLLEQLARRDGSLDYEVRGALTERGHESLSLKVTGTLWFNCQRCLEAMPVAIDSARLIVFAQNPLGVERDYEDDDTDVVDVVDWMDLTEFIEDEVLLSMPQSPKHETQACGTVKETMAEQRMSPFSVLAKFGRPPSERGIF